MNMVIGYLFAAFDFSLAGGASSAVLATAAVTSFENGISTNPAMVARLGRFGCSLFYANPYSVDGLHFSRAGFNLAKPVRIGFGISGLGMDGYQELTFTAAAAFPVGRSFSWGIGLEGLYLGIRDFGADFVPALDLGILWQEESYALGLAVDRLNQPRLRSGDGLPVALHAGGLLKPVKSLSVSADFVKEKNAGERFLAGAEFEVVRGCGLRAGIGVNPFIVAAGVGLRYRSFRLDYGLRFHPRLKETHAIGLGVTGE